MFENIKKYLFLNLSEKNTKILALSVAFIEVIVWTILCITWSYSYSDELEHMHSSFLVWQGNIPYKDFFQHHHPLLWFLFAPIMGLFYNNAQVYYVAHFFSLVFSLITWYFIYKIITEFISTSKTWVLTLVIVMTYAYLNRELTIEFRPDIYMYATFFCGLYYYMLHLKTNKTKFLSISLILFLISVLFLQKIALLLIVLGVYTLYLVIKRKVELKKLLISIIPALILLSLFILYFILTNSFDKYWLLNFELNSLMGKYYGLTHVYYHILSSREAFPLINGYSAVRFSLFSTVSSFCAVLMLPNFTKEKNIYKKIIGLLFIFELIIRYFTFSPYSQYFYLLHILSGIIIFSELIKSKSIYINITLSFFVIVYFFHSIEFILSQNKKSSLSEQVKMLQYIIDNTDDNDIVLNGMLDYFNMFRQDADYIWFAANDTGYIYDLHYNTKRYDINEIIKRKKPKFINTYEVSLIPYYRRINVLNKYNFDTLRLFQLKQETKFTIDDVLVKVPHIIYHKFDMEYIKKYYEPTPYENLWMRKDNISE